MNVETITTVTLTDEDRNLLSIADRLDGVLTVLNEAGIPLDRGFEPRDGERAGAYYYAQEALREVLAHLTGDREEANNILNVRADNGERVSYIVENLAKHWVVR